MAKHPHYEVMMEWAADTSKVVQCKSKHTGEWIDWEAMCNPDWSPNYEYRIKPEKKPDVVVTGIVATDIGYVGNASYRTAFRISEHYEKDNIRLTFDGDTGKLIKAEVLHAE